jgi:hypothetical protein
VVVGRVAAGVRTEMEKRVLAQEALVVATWGESVLITKNLVKLWFWVGAWLAGFHCAILTSAGIDVFIVARLVIRQPSLRSFLARGDLSLVAWLRALGVRSLGLCLMVTGENYRRLGNLWNWGSLPCLLGLALGWSFG